MGGDIACTTLTDGLEDNGSIAMRVFCDLKLLSGKDISIGVRTSH
jgi:hypothetical protein